MIAPGWRVPRGDAERVRRLLRERGLLRSDLSVVHEGDSVVFPITGPPVSAIDAGELVSTEFSAYGARGPRTYAELVDVPAELRTLLPRSYDVVGDVVLIRVPEELVPYSATIGAALLRFVPGARVVGRDEGVHGPARQRRLVEIAGSGGWATHHRENGLTLEVDLGVAYFSPRLAREHARVARAVPRGARALDLCCGVGPFALAIAHAGRAREVVAVDSNPAAIELLQRNVARLGLAGRVRAVEADVGAFLASAGLARHAILNLPHEGIKYLSSVGNVVEPGGSIDYYEITDRSAWSTRPAELLALMERGPWQLSARHVVHAYSPRSDLVAYTISRGPA